MLEKAVSFVLLGVGAVWFAAAWDLASGAAGYGGAFPLGLSALLAGLSLLLLVVPSRARPTRSPSPAPESPGRRGVVAAAGLVAMLAVYAIFFDFLGYVTATLLLGTAYLRLVHGASWKESLGVSALVTIGGHLVFRVLLNVPLPAGVLTGILSG